MERKSARERTRRSMINGLVVRKAGPKGAESATRHMEMFLTSIIDSRSSDWLVVPTDGDPYRPHQALQSWKGNLRDVGNPRKAPNDPPIVSLFFYQLASGTFYLPAA